MLTCQDVSRLLSDAQEERLPLLTRVRLRVHLAMCRPCAELEDQLAVLESALGAYRARILAGELREEDLPSEVRARIARAVEAADEDGSSHDD